MGILATVTIWHFSPNTHAVYCLAGSYPAQNKNRYGIVTCAEIFGMTAFCHSIGDFGISLPPYHWLAGHGRGKQNQAHTAAASPA